MSDYTNARGGVAVPKPAGSSARKNKKRAYNQEVRTAGQFTAAGVPAKRVPMSGALKGVGLDGDIDIGSIILGLLGECKNYTPVEDVTGTYLKLYIRWLDKIEAEAALHGKPGAVIYQAKGSSDPFIVMRLKPFQEILGRAFQAIEALKGNQ
jgi:hypothetical protein